VARKSNAARGRETGAELLVNIDVPDLEKAIAFYRDGLGLRFHRRLFAGAAEMVGRSARVYLLEKREGSEPVPGQPARRSYERHWTPVHIDFVVADLDAAVQAAHAQGARPEGPLQVHPWGRMATMADPFGNGFCLIQFLGEGYGEA
jgi:predicted enzyme related to lactoylglutathione lyase